MRTVIALLLLLLLPTPFAHAGKRVALVIGNSAYQHTPKLDNPKNDAVDMAAALRQLGFEVVEGIDLDKRGFDQKVLAFAAALKGSDVGVFFYAGHGMQVAGQNYLVPTDAKAEAAETLDFEMVRVDVVQRIMERLTNTNILFLDACRDNPLARNLARSMGTRSAEVGRGLAIVEAGIGTLISFSTQPGNVALDGTGRNSPFAGALVKFMSSSNNDLSAILIAVRNDVMKETQRKQVPWEHSALTGQFYFRETPALAPAAPPPPSQPDQGELERAWKFIKETKDQAQLEAFIKRFPDTPYAVMARARLEELKTKVAPAPAPSQDAQSINAERAWSAIRDTSSIGMLEAFITRYKGTFYAELAQARLRELQTKPISTQPDLGSRRSLAEDHPFDGRWEARMTGGDACPAKTGRYNFAIVNNVVERWGSSVNASGEVTFVTPSILDRNVRLQHVLRLVGHSGTGRYRAIGHKCIGTELVRRISTYGP
jgi:caspase domain-containing protein